MSRYVAGRHAFSGGSKTSDAQIAVENPALYPFTIDYSQVCKGGHNSCSAVAFS